MFKWIKNLFCRKKKETPVDLLIICETIKPLKQKRDKKGRFTK
jgi:hypothetical protein